MPDLLLDHREKAGHRSGPPVSFHSSPGHDKPESRAREMRRTLPPDDRESSSDYPDATAQVPRSISSTKVRSGTRSPTANAFRLLTGFGVEIARRALVN